MRCDGDGSQGKLDMNPDGKTVHRGFIGVGEYYGSSAPPLVANEQGGMKVWLASHPSACVNQGRTT